MAKFAEAFLAKVTPGLDEQLAELDQKILKFTTELVPKHDEILSQCHEYKKDILNLEAGIEDMVRKRQEKEGLSSVEQAAHDEEHLFKSAIGPDNPKTLHDLYQEMDLLEIEDDDDDDDDDPNVDSGNEEDVGEEEEEDEIIFLGVMDSPTTTQKRTANQANLTPPPNPAQQKQSGNSKAGTVVPGTKPTHASAQAAPSPKVPQGGNATTSSPQARVGQGASTAGSVQVQQPLQPRTVPKPVEGQRVFLPGQSSVALPSGQLYQSMQPVQQARPVPTSQPGQSLQASMNGTPPRVQQPGIASQAVPRQQGQQARVQQPGIAPQTGPQQGQQSRVPQPVQQGKPAGAQHPSMVLQTSPQQRPQVTGRYMRQGAPATKVPLSQGGKKTVPDVVEIIDDDDDIVILSSTPPTARKSTASKTQARQPPAPKTQLVVHAPSRPPLPAQSAALSAGFEQEYDPNMMEGEDMMFGDDDATLPELVEGKKVLAKGEESFWFPGSLIGPPIHHKGKKKYKVKFEHNRKRLLSSKFLAVVSPSKPGDLAVGIRVVASYIVEDGTKTKGMYAGIIAEVPMKTNRGRYLVFFDDGYAQYLSCEKIHIVYHSSPCVWADVDISSRDFIRDYLDKYPLRAMVSLKAGQIVSTEWNGEWWDATVQEVQGSLANMLFKITPSRHFETEWIYRGSTRLKPLYENIVEKKPNIIGPRGPGIEHVRNNLPYVEMTKVHSDHILSEQQIPQPKPSMLGRLNDPQAQAASTSSSDPYHFSHLLKHCAEQSDQVAPNRAQGQPGTEKDSPEDSRRKKKKKKKNKHKEKRKERYEDDAAFEPDIPIATPSIRTERKKYRVHQCSVACVQEAMPKIISQATRNLNPLLYPMVFGWVRELNKERGKNSRRYVVYRTPCGKSLCSFDDIRRYLSETAQFVLSVDRFSFDPFVHISVNQRRSRQNRQFYYMQLNDLSKGIEKVPVSCVNEYDTDEPPPMKYMTEKSTVRGKQVNLDPEFLICCDCVDDCSDASKCACRQLTIEASACQDGNPKKDAGYKDRLLHDSIITGIYECNSRCHCSANCENKVVQNGLSLRLQVFKTLDRGWGIRCLDDIPRGMFVCTYTGQIWNDDEANQKGKEHGDEYFAELDYIENVERLKEGYEDDVEDIDPIDEDYSEPDSDEDDSNERTQSSSDEFQPSQSDVSSDDSANMVQSVFRREEDKDSTNQGETSGGGTKLVLRRQSESTEQSQWSVSLASSEKKEAPPSTPTRVAETKDASSDSDKSDMILKYGYDPSPSKEFLDKKSLDAYRQRRQAEKAARQRLSTSENESKPNKGKDGKNNDEDDDDIQIIGWEETKPSTSSSSSTSKMAAVETKGAGGSKDAVSMATDDKKQAQDTITDKISRLTTSEGVRKEEDGVKKEEIKTEEKPPRPRVVSGPRARKSTSSRMMRQRYLASPGAATEVIKEEKPNEKDKKPPTTRSLFGEKHCYVMDAKFSGNLGRYFNHSCRPNLFVQNVFVDSHDLRFPWVAFFAAQYIRAGMELSWDYHYDVGCVPGKEIKCLCRHPDCRGRLL